MYIIPPRSGKQLGSKSKSPKQLGMASFYALSVLVLVLSSSWFCSTESHGVDVTGAAGQREFDYFLLSLQWPGTLCQRTTHCCPKNGCCRSDATLRFTIHGLWANYNDGTWPACCNGGRFDVKQIKPLLEGLQKYWPTLSCGSPSTCHGSKGLFWAHEWEKHGTCSSPVFKDEYSYFLATLNLYFKYNVTEILRVSGYVPSNSEKYPLGGIVSAIQNAVRATPQLTCKNGAIEELHICFYKDFEPRNCVVGGDRLASSSCPKYVSLPDHVSMNLQGTSIPWSSEVEDL